MKIKYDMQLMKLMNIFTKITRAELHDAFVDNNSLLHFVVAPNELGKAIGKQGSNVKKIERLLNRKIKILEFNPDALQFVRNTVFPLKIKSIEQDNDKITIEADDTKTRGLLIGRSAQNLRNTESIVKRYFEISEIKVI